MAKKPNPLLDLDRSEASDQSPDQGNQIKAAELQKAFVKGLADKNGEGLNANVLKLTKEIKNLHTTLVQQVKSNEILFKSLQSLVPKDKSKKDAVSSSPFSFLSPISRASGSGISKGGFYGDYAQYDSTDAQGRASIESAKKYAGPKSGGGIKGALKRNFTMEGWFGDIADAPIEEQGLLGRFGARKVRENRFVEEQKKLGKSNLYDIRTNFREKEKIQRQQGENEAEISKLVESGWSEENIAKHKKTRHLLDTREELDKGLKSKDIGYRYKRSREDQKEQEEQLEEETTPQAVAPQAALPEVTQPSITTAVAAPIAAAPTTGTGESGTEIEQENVRMMEEQNKLLQEIAENTKPLADMAKVFGSKPAEGEGGVSAAAPEGGGIIDTITDILPAAAGGSLMGGLSLGTALTGGALATTLGAAAYQGYQGWNNAESNLDIKDREATTGEKVASSLGSIGTLPGKLANMVGVPEDWQPVSDEKEASKGMNAFTGGMSLKDFAVGTVGAIGGVDSGVALKKWMDGDSASSDQQAVASPVPTNSVAPTSSAGMSEQVYKMSDEVSTKPAPKTEASPTVISSPTVNNNSTNVYPSKSPARNTDSSYQKYAFDSRFEYA